MGIIDKDILSPAYMAWAYADEAVNAYEGSDKGVARELDAAESNALIAYLATPATNAKQRTEKLRMFIERDITNWRGSQPLIDAILADASIDFPIEK